MSGNLVTQQRQQAVAIAPPDILSLPPRELIPRATEIADVLKNVVESQRLYTSIGPKKYVNVEGWTTLGSLMGITPREVEVVENQQDGSYTAIVELYNTRTGQIVGRGSALVSRDEKTWAKRPRYALRSMAVTRATGKAFRLSFSWIMSLAGYAVTPAEEMPPVNYNPPPVKNNEQNNPPVTIEATRVVPPIDTYNEKDIGQKKRLREYLAKDGRVSADLFDYVSGCMNGLPMTTGQIKKLIDEVIGEPVASSVEHTAEEPPVIDVEHTSEDITEGDNVGPF